MAQWYTYSTDSTSSDEELDSDTLERNHDLLCKQLSMETESVSRFFTELSEECFLYNFKYRLHPTIQDWSYPRQLSRPEYHFKDLVDNETIRMIQEGIGKSPTYNGYETTRRPSFTPKEIRIIFKYAEEWIEIASLGRTDYVNDLCWVASNIIAFQVARPNFKKRF